MPIPGAVLPFIGFTYLPPKTDNYAAAATEPRLGAPFVRSGGACTVAPAPPSSPWIFVGAPSKTLARSPQNERSSRRGGWKLELIFSLFLRSSVRPSRVRSMSIDLPLLLDVWLIVSAGPSHASPPQRL